MIFVMWASGFVGNEVTHRLLAKNLLHVLLRCVQVISNSQKEV